MRLPEVNLEFWLTARAVFYRELADLGYRSASDLLDDWRRTGKVRLSALAAAMLPHVQRLDFAAAQAVTRADREPPRVLMEFGRIAVQDAARAEAFLHALHRDPRPELVAVEWPLGEEGAIAEQWTDGILARWNEVEGEKETLREVFASWPATNLATLNRPMAQAMRGQAERRTRSLVRRLREREAR